MKQFIAFSGGIDSTSLALLMTDAVPVFTDTGWEFDELYAHIDKFEEVTGREVLRLKNEKLGGSIPQYIQDEHYLPSFRSRWCTDHFKIRPMNRFLRAERPCELLIGLRADEPAVERVGNLTKMKGLTIRYPLREYGLNRAWCVQKCLEADLLPRFPVYMARGGCKGCFYKRKSEVRAMAALTPEILDELQTLEEEVQDERGRFFCMFPNIGTSIHRFREQQPLLEPEQIYRDAADRTDLGEACGLFCHR